MSFPVKRFVSYYKPYRNMFLLVLASAVLISMLSLLFPLLVRHITTDVLEGNLDSALNQVYLIGAVMLGLVLTQNVCTYFLDYKGHQIGAKMERDMRSELFEHMQKLSFEFYDKQTTGQLMSRITNDLMLLAELFHHGPEDYLRYSIRFIGAFCILFYINAAVTMAVFAFLPFLAIFSWYANKAMNRVLIKNKERMGDINAQVEDSLSGIRVVQSFANESIENRKFQHDNQRFYQSRNGYYKAECLFANGVDVFVNLITITVIILGSAKIVGGSFNLADLITFLLYIGFLVEPIQKLPHMSMQLQEGLTGFQRFMQIMDIKPSISEKENAYELSHIRGEVEFKGVTFHYEQSLKPVLINQSLVIKPGEYVALVGTSGVGKSTLCSLIPRFYDVSAGSVHLDGVNVKDLKLSHLRSQVGVVQQDVYLFAGTILDNIRYGRPHASNDEVIQAAKLANAHEFISGLPNGYHSEIGQRGVRLSGGQKQRLSIARTFLKDPAVLIFDEATSALDNESEGIVKESLEQLAKGRTTIVIAHRLSTIRHAKRILVLTEDGIAEQGTHEHLMSLNGSYAKLYAKQFV
ncbi:ABC transporter ATP-binding protein [Alkalicoccobacillus porphyridii]|uniref:ABC transporter ATP-binding protein n=1 Tax=Alkalicoccobacillus porphyridii TaxID=2597270 RepID=A0A553ZYK8_9BACI|nr:ABC transporter ATP-binding protein [Alkalicoccobacillus porphyridii]TSB46529.1 ABC transporter ATP-binding protein [Alkalicoccobacillus porphyridii]